MVGWTVEWYVLLDLCSILNTAILASTRIHQYISKSLWSMES